MLYLFGNTEDRFPRGKVLRFLYYKVMVSVRLCQRYLTAKYIGSLVTITADVTNEDPLTPHFYIEKWGLQGGGGVGGVNYFLIFAPKHTFRRF